jgi:hypothetical protein
VDEQATPTVALFLRLDPGAPLDGFVQPLLVGTSLPQLSALSKRLRLAVDLFHGSFFEGSTYAQFVARIAVLEVLKDERDQSPEIQDAVGRWIGEVDALAYSSVLDRSVSDSLRGRLRYLKQESISRTIFRLVEDALGMDKAKEALGLYDLRSRMLHDGDLATRDLSGEPETLTDIDQRLLRVLLKRA